MRQCLRSSRCFWKLSWEKRKRRSRKKLDHWPSPSFSIVCLNSLAKWVVLIWCALKHIHSFPTLFMRLDESTPVLSEIFSPRELPSNSLLPSFSTTGFLFLYWKQTIRSTDGAWKGSSTADAFLCPVQSCLLYRSLAFFPPVSPTTGERLFGFVSGRALRTNWPS